MFETLLVASAASHVVPGLQFLIRKMVLKRLNASLGVIIPPRCTALPTMAPLPGHPQRIDE